MYSLSTFSIRRLRRYPGQVPVRTLVLFGALLLPQTALAEPLTTPVIQLQAEQAYTVERRYAGTTVARRSTELGFKRGGEVAAVYVDLGAQVERGAILAELDRQSLQAEYDRAAALVAVAVANQEAAAADAELARNTEQRMHRLHQSGHASQQVYDEARLTWRARHAQVNVANANLTSAKAALKTAAVALREAQITAPFSGRIQARYADEGSQLRGGQPLLRLVEAEHVEAHIGIPLAALGGLIQGNSYSLQLRDTQLTATLQALMPEIDSNSRTTTAVFALDSNLGGELARNIPVGAVIELAYRQPVTAQGFWLPVGSLTSAERGLWAVYVVGRDNQVQRRLVDVIHTEAERVFARGTLSDGDRLISTGINRVVPGQVVTPIPAMQANAR